MKQAGENMKRTKFKEQEEGFIERRIVIGLITNDYFIREVMKIGDPVQFLESSMANRIAGWCVKYYLKYGKAPNKDIESIYFQMLKDGLPKDIAEEIEHDILPGLSREYEESKFNIEYLLDQTIKYFHEQQK